MMSGPTIEVPARTVAEWAALIRYDLGQALGGIVAAGKHLIEARCDLGRGRFGEMLRVVRMHERTAERLMRIAESPVLTNPDFAACLPTSMRTLSELTRFASPILKGYLQNGTINVATERAQVEALLKEPKPTHGSGSELSQPVAESWAQAKPAVERMEAAMARNAEEEAEALAEEVEATEPCCSFCDRADVDHLVANAGRTALICWECSVQVLAILGQQNLAKQALVCSVCGTKAACDCGAPAHHVKRGRPKGSKKKKRVAPARRHGDEPDRHYEKARATESGGNGSAPDEPGDGADQGVIGAR